jgi:hypothetical protein
MVLLPLDVATLTDVVLGGAHARAARARGPRTLPYTGRRPLVVAVVSGPERADALRSVQ